MSPECLTFAHLFAIGFPVFGIPRDEKRDSIDTCSEISELRSPRFRVRNHHFWGTFFFLLVQIMSYAQTSRSVHRSKAPPMFILDPSSSLAVSSSNVQHRPSKFEVPDIFNVALSGKLPTQKLPFQVLDSLSSSKNVPGEEFGLFEHLRPSASREPQVLREALTAFLHIGWTPPFPSIFAGFPTLTDDIIEFVRQLIVVPDLFLEALEYNLPYRRSPLLLPGEEESVGRRSVDFNNSRWGSRFPNLSEAEVDELGKLFFYSKSALPLNSFWP